MSRINLLLAGLLFAVLLLIPTSTQAQQWSAEEQEVLNHVEECFASFTEASELNDPQVWVRRCRPTDESLFWWAPNAGPISLEALLRDWELTLPKSKRFSSIGFEPMRIRLIDDMAFVYGYTSWYDEQEDGSLNYFHDKRLEVYRKQGGLWSLISIVWLPVAAE